MKGVNRMQMLRRVRWLLLVLILVPGLMALTGCDLEVEEPVDDPPPVEEPIMP